MSCKRMFIEAEALSRKTKTSELSWSQKACRTCSRHVSAHRVISLTFLSSFVLKKLTSRTGLAGFGAGDFQKRSIGSIYRERERLQKSLHDSSPQVSDSLRRLLEASLSNQVGGLSLSLSLSFSLSPFSLSLSLPESVSLLLQGKERSP